jgi:hypothetical protein
MRMGMVGHMMIERHTTEKIAAIGQFGHRRNDCKACAYKSTRFFGAA